MSSRSSKSMSVQREKSPPRKEEKKQNSRQDPDSHKIFLTNLNGEYSQQQVENQVRRLFEKYGEVKKLSLKKHKNGYYYFGFLEFPSGFQAYESVKALDQHPLFGKNMKVRQDRQSEGCFYCKRMGHFARQCPENKERRRSYSNDRRRDDRHERRRDDRFERYDNRRDRERDFREDRGRDRQRQRQRGGDRYERNDRYERERENQRDRHRHERRRQRSRSYSDSKSSSESSRRRNDRKEKKDRKRRSRS